MKDARLILVLLFSAAIEACTAQPAPVPQRVERISLTSGMQQALSDTVSIVYSDTVAVAHAPWLQVMFSKAHLGAGSYLVLTSLQDGAVQKMDARALAEWKNKSASFNGHAVLIQLYVAPGDEDVFFAIEEVIVGIRGGSTPNQP